MCVRLLLIVCAVMAMGAAELNLTIGYLALFTGEKLHRQGLIVSGAMSLAVEELNNSTDILPDVKILLEWHDTKSEAATGLVKDMSDRGVAAFFGPEVNCYDEAVLAQTYNLPMFSFKCNDYQTSSLTSFVRMDPTGDEFMKAVISLLRYYRWNKFSILHEESWTKEARYLAKLARNNNWTINHQQMVLDSYGNSEEPQGFFKVIQDTKDQTRNPLLLLNSCPNFSDGFKKRARSLLVVTTPELSSNFEVFADKVREYNKRAPFHIPNLMGNKKYITVYAAYLYDSVKIYAKALDELIKEDMVTEKLTYDKLTDIVKAGSRIVKMIVKNSPYESISGLPIKFDEKAVAERHLSLLAFNPTQTRPRDFQCSYAMMPVASFLRSNKEYPVYKLNPRMPIEWPDSVKPEDEPACGFQNVECREETRSFYSRLSDWLNPFY